MYGSIESPSICFNPCVGRNSSGARFGHFGRWGAERVSIRVLVGIAQEPDSATSGAGEPSGFQSVCWSE